MFGSKLKKLIKNEEDGKKEGNDKKKIENLVFFVVLLIITVVTINIIWNGKKDTKQNNNQDTSKKLATSQNSKNGVEVVETNNKLEEKLKNILSKIQGVGNVEVCIHYSESSETVAMYNENSKISTTEESDTSGGNRKIQETDSQKDIIYQEVDGKKIPMTKKTIEPKIEGAIITAQGVNNATTKNNVIQAVEALTGLATHKIQVFEMN